MGSVGRIPPHNGRHDFDSGVGDEFLKPVVHSGDSFADLVDFGVKLNDFVFRSIFTANHLLLEIVKVSEARIHAAVEIHVDGYCK